MQLWLVVQPVGEEPSDFAVEVAPECPAKDLVDALARQVGADSSRAAAYCQRLQRWLTGEETVSSLGLQTGDRIVVSPEVTTPNARVADIHPRELRGRPDRGCRFEQQHVSRRRSRRGGTVR